jgi:hypothetical protein
LHIYHFIYLPPQKNQESQLPRYCKSDFVTSGSGGGLGIMLEGAFGSVFHSSW